MLFISGSVDEKDVTVRLNQELATNPHSDFLRKPFNIQDLVIKTKMLLADAKRPAS